jgi:predicted ATP-grasp superfamily ATP-dependent carboligase
LRALSPLPSSPPAYRLLGRPASPASLDVILLDAQERQAVANARSLRREGLRVGVAACAPLADRAPGLRTRSRDLAAVLPGLARDPGDFVDALQQLVEDTGARVVIPTFDGTVEALRGRRAELEPRVGLALASERALAIAVDKGRTLALARELRIAVPEGVAVRSAGDLSAALRATGFPAVLKPDRSWAQDAGERLTSAPVLSLKEAEVAYAYMAERGATVEAQRWLPGRRDAVSFFLEGDRVLARFAQTSYREFPALGGVSVLCESIPMLDDIAAPAERLVRAIGLEGPAMVEFRRDAGGRPVLMEVNARLAGSTSLAVRCGVNLPLLAYNWAAGLPNQPVGSYRTGRRVRWLAGDVWNLRVAFGQRGRPDVPSRAAATARFAWDFLARPAALDPLSFGDPLPGVVDLRANVVKPLAGAASRTLRRRLPRRSRS